jgi:hypothetical protein
LSDETFENLQSKPLNKTHRVYLDKMLAYMSLGRKGRNDTPHKKKLHWPTLPFG